MSTLNTSGAIQIRFREYELEGLDEEDVQQYIEDMVREALTSNTGLDNAVQSVEVTELVIEPRRKLAEITISVDTRISVSYDPDETDIQDWAHDHAEVLIENAVSDGDYSVEVENEDAGNPDFADISAEDL